MGVAGEASAGGIHPFRHSNGAEPIVGELRSMMARRGVA
jgi:hypothetical protein